MVGHRISGHGEQGFRCRRRQSREYYVATWAWMTLV